VEIQDLAEEYRGKSDEELLRLATDVEDLTPEANVALKDELSRCRIDTPEILTSFREEEAKRREEECKETGRLFVLHSSGIGRDRFGKADRVYNPETGMERFKTTVFILLIWFPLVPTGTFLVERKRSWFSNEVTIL